MRGTRPLFGDGYSWTASRLRTNFELLLTAGQGIGEAQLNSFQSSLGSSVPLIQELILTFFIGLAQFFLTLKILLTPLALGDL
jgi:hypothetical protein